MRVYNTLTRSKEKLITIENKKVKMYVCGPTVYNYIHIGNARPVVVFDTVRRYLEYRGYEVEYVQNFTDIDDKIINVSKELSVNYEEVSEKYIKEFMYDSDKLNILKAKEYPRVTKEIKEIICMIEDLEKKGYAYEVNGVVYFNTKKYKKYGRLTNRRLEDLLDGARVEKNNDKKNSTDFILWKKAKKDEPSWESPYGKGRPGWHIECSAMCKKYLGDTIDIHCGGADLAFPHHENEVAQSEASNGKPLANYWLHNGFINVNNEKMSKSKGNFFTLREIGEKFDYDVVRFFILSVQYRSPLNFDEELLIASKNGLDRIKKCLESLKYEENNSKDSEDDKKDAIKIDRLNKFREKFILAMDDDFNTANAIAVIYDLIKYSNVEIIGKSSKKIIVYNINLIEELLEVLGLDLGKNEMKEVDVKKIEKLIEERKVAKKNKDFKKADEIRSKLLEKGIVLEDKRDGVKWSFING